MKVHLPPYQPSHIIDYILPDEEPIIKPVAKKRKVIISDDEDLGDEPVATTSKIPKKGKKKSSKAQAKRTGKSASQVQESGSNKVLAVEPAEDNADDIMSDEEGLAAASTT
jgi:hypothetical protein